MPESEHLLVFHVGAAPTASWVVHQCLEKNAKAWQERGIRCLPNKVLTDDIGSGEPLIDDPSRLSEVLRAAFDHPDTTVVAGSREVLGAPFGGAAGAGLHAAAKPAIEALAEATKGVARRKIVLSVCPPEQFVELHFSRTIAAGGTDSLDTWLARIDLDDLSWLPLHAALAGVFGPDAVEVVEFSPTDAGHVRWLQRFFAVAGVELPDAIAANTPAPAGRLSAKGLRLAVAANPWLASGPERSTLRTFLQRHFSEFDGPTAEFLTPGQRSAARERYDAELVRMTVATEVGQR